MPPLSHSSHSQQSSNIKLHIACYSDFYIWHQDHQDHIHYFQTINNDWSSMPASKPGQTGLLKTQFPRWKFSWSREGSVSSQENICSPRPPVSVQCSPCKTHKSPQIHIVLLWSNHTIRQIFIFLFSLAPIPVKYTTDSC